MKQKLARVSSSLRGELPDHIDGFFLEHAEGVLGIFLDGESPLAGKCLVFELVGDLFMLSKC